jgi:tetratricopeptide (TPR) repeat protein
MLTEGAAANRPEDFAFMPSEFRQFDEHGFPVAPRFEAIVQPDEPVRQPKLSVRAKRLILIGLVVGVVVPVVFGTQLLSFGRDLLAQWHSSRAQKKFQDHDLSGAVAELSCAIEWSPDDIYLRCRRAAWRAEQQDLTGSIADWSDAIRMVESAIKLPLAQQQFIEMNRDSLASLYAQRGWVYVRLRQTQQALDDANKAVELSPSSENLNSRAYSRAILNVELEEGLKDIKKALEEAGGNDPELLDTKGYLLHLLNRNDEALKDLERAIETLNRFEPLPRATIMRSLAVMYHHRGLIYQALGQNKEAQHDLKLGDQWGYNPANGVL